MLSRRVLFCTVEVSLGQQKSPALTHGSGLGAHPDNFWWCRGNCSAPGEVQEQSAFLPTPGH